ncbi:MAG: hypothetical protein A3G33_00190 [Omnitrophica bacterium RIFCSPLOWO2_12_FULL_44_17]|uniref:Acyltransferase 3 domain-containing protein n=1 Tax=Candidatus Danuiimicrobium aquiferis TaxID=1801832 RepID=A0A1G1KTH8_9BACT|nr:MAG: hypothetical protein A3B72_00275 [Omnitrophica bacterium RIFCSPHIGHO2_02_FULL_45_28]OGW92479.1 MAG: hypothetical protein A3E74_10130 [Omnitrophica bacterium RIFCSPHIGHO2_12_FULL_44_12]OGW96217.1 MAG: hypothetical protein A3G33_00190 [Omnitrophica bacterium RIFCSPLOWO2_12_FULL_44_17]OGX02129.1 MAG: hypothetical protein A3J12_01770 [Omnitrophica bacterium RIFCSPLOWO2_02_FULL_44_11]
MVHSHQTIENSQETLFWADLIRAIVVFGVVLVHVSADVITEWSKFPRSWWWAANIYDSLARGCVPAFVMLSGALLLPKIESYRDFFGKRFQRVMIPFVAWTVFYLLWKKHFYEPDLGFFEALIRAANNKVHFHLWFLYVIVGLYMITPVFRVLMAHMSRRHIFYFLILCFFVASFFPFSEKLIQVFANTKIRFSFPIEPVQGFIGYFVLGHFIRQSDTKKFVPAVIVMWVTSLLICAMGSYFLSSHFHSFQSLLYDNMAPNVVFYTATFFIIVKHAGPVIERHLNSGLRNLITNFSKASFGIYLIHPIILEALAVGRWGFKLKGDVLHPFYMIPITTAVIYLLSFFVILLIQKIPYLRKIT